MATQKKRPGRISPGPRANAPDANQLTNASRSARAVSHETSTGAKDTQPKEPNMGFEAREMVPGNMGRHGAERFRWRDLLAAIEAPDDLGPLPADKQAAAQAKERGCRAICRPCTDGKRNGANVAAVGFLAVDVDGGNFDGAVKRLRKSGLRWAAYTTPTHKAPWNDAGDRYRVFVAVRNGDVSLVALATSDIVRSVLRLPFEGVDPKSFAPEQFWFLPATFGGLPYRHEHGDGQPFDRWDILDLLADEPPKSRSATIDPQLADLDRGVVVNALRADPFAAWVVEHLCHDPQAPSVSGNGFVAVRCPWGDEHTDGRDGAYFVPRTPGRRRPVFKCHHSHCAERGIADLLDWARANGCPHTGRRLEDFYFVADSRETAVDSVAGMEYPLSATDTLVPESEWPTYTDEKGRQKQRPPSKALREHGRHQWVNTIVYDPNEPELIEGRMVDVGGLGYTRDPDSRLWNRYLRPPSFDGGDASKASMWLKLVDGLYGHEPEAREHLVRWFAHCVRYPGKKISHALVLSGAQGIGKDSLLHPIETLVGYANAKNIGVDVVFSGFDPWKEAVLLKIDEVRPSDSHTLVALYEKLKPMITAPPTMLQVNQKFAPMRWVPNIVKVVLTTNHPDAIHVPPDDRRLCMLDTDRAKGWRSPEWFGRYYRWLANGGIAHVRAYLENVDLSQFDPNAPPPQTAAWHLAVEGRQRVGGDDVCALGLDVLRRDNGGEAPRVLFSRELTEAVERVDDDDENATAARLQVLRRFPAKVKKLMLAQGYEAIRNPSAADGRWILKIGPKLVKLGLAWGARGATAEEVDQRRRSLRGRYAL